MNDSSQKRDVFPTQHLKEPIGSAHLETKGHWNKFFTIMLHLNIGTNK